MSVAKCLGVDDLKDLPCWMRKAEPAERDAVVSALLRLGAADKRASMVLAWLLVPGASLLVGRLRNLVDVIDEVVAGQLWIQICDHDPSDDKYVAKKVLSRVEREAKAELGVGDLAERPDPAWAATVLVERFNESILANELDEEDPTDQLATLLRRALDDGDITEARRDLLLDLAHAANLLSAALRRGRAGLTAPSVAQMVCDEHALCRGLSDATRPKTLTGKPPWRPGRASRSNKVMLFGILTPPCEDKVV